MLPSHEHLRRLTFALRDPARARAAAAALVGVEETAAREGLCDLLADPPDDAAATTALRALAPSLHPQAQEAVRQAILTGSATVRFAALHLLRCQRSPNLGPLLGRVVAGDPSVRVRREALRALALLPAEERWPLLTALSDPVWRVRNDAVRHLQAWQRQDSTLLEKVRARLAPLEHRDRATAGAFYYLEFLLTPGAEPPPRSAVPSATAEPWRAAAWWDDDPPILEQNLRHLTEQEVRADLALLPGLLTLQEGRPVWPFVQGIGRFVVRALERFGQPEHLAATLRLLDEPRRPRTADWVRRLFGRLTPDRRRQVSASILPQPDGVDEPHGALMETARALAERATSPEEQLLLKELQHHADHRVRAAALTRSRAEALWVQPETETSWRVLARAAAVLQRPLAQIAPPGHETIHARATRRGARETVGAGLLRAWKLPPRPVQARPLGATGLTVSPLGLSGRYGLPERGFRRAMEAGVNLFFWEPGYHTQTRCWQHLVPSLKERLTVVAGSFASEPRSVRRDLEQALLSLRVDRLDVFLLFWVRSPQRLSEETLEVLEEARHAGLTRTVGLSTHLRPLAVAAVGDGWPVLMVRHSLAHRGAEEELLPLAHAAGTGLITFSNLYYGRLPAAPASSAARGPRPSPADCYRYSLSQPGVSACLTAPRDLEQLQHNLQVLQAPTLDGDTQAALRPWGDAVYGPHRAFVEWMRSR